MGDDEQAEGESLADRPGLLAGRLVVGVEGLGGHGVDGGDGDGHLGVEDGMVDVIRDVNWWGKGSAAGRRRGDESGAGIGRELEEFSRR